MAESPLLGVLRDRRLFSGPLPFVLLGLLGLNITIETWRGDLAEQRVENLLLRAPGSETSDAPAREARFDASVGEDLGVYFPQIPNATKTPLVVLSGMSQMYAINEAKPSDQTISEWMDDTLAKEGIRVFGLAAPNLHNEEALLYLVATAAAPETRPDVFLYGLCFDKFRNVDVRDGLADFLRKNKPIREAWRSVCASRKDAYPLACEKMHATDAGLDAAGKAQDDDSVEHLLRAGFGAVLPMVAGREDLNVTAQLQAHYLRNWVFQIEPSTKRPIIRSRYDLNKELLRLMIDVAKESGITLGLYVIPLNPLAENPYVAEEYEDFKRWAETLATEASVPFANLESIVPENEWGEFLGGPDFKHFKGEGHRITAAALVETFGPIVREAAKKRAKR